MTPGNVVAILAWAAIVYWLASELIRQLLDEFDQRRRVRELDRQRAEVLVMAREQRPRR